MTERELTAPEYRRKSLRKATGDISAVLFTGVLMLAVNFAISVYLYGMLPVLFGASFPEAEWQGELADIVMNLLLLLIPATFLLAVFRMNPVSPFAGPLSAPKYPFLFIPMCIGALYALNFIVNKTLGGLFAPFDRAIDPSSYSTTLPGMLLFFVQLAILPALLEEWLFRGVMLRRLLRSVGKWPAILLSAFVFGLMHLNPAQSIFAFGFGIFAGYVYVNTGSIWFGALIHMLNNAISGCATYWMNVFEQEYVTAAFGIFMLLAMLFGVIYLPFYCHHAKKTELRARRTEEERLLPEGGEVFRVTLRNPVLYLLIGGYGFLLWLFYLAF